MSIATVDFTKVGKTPVGKVKVTAFKDKWRKSDGSSAILWVNVDGVDSRAFQMWEPKGNKGLAVGDEFDATIEVKEEEYNGNKQLAVWLIPSSGGGKRGGGGGGGNYTPNDEAPIACQVMIKEACEIARFEAINKGEKEVDLSRASAIFDALSDAYVRNYPKVKGAHGA